MSASRIEVTIHASKPIDTRYRYVVLKTRDGWRIDRRKVWQGSGWKSDLLTL